MVERILVESIQCVNTVICEFSYTTTLLRLDSRKLSPKEANLLWVTASLSRQNFAVVDECVLALTGIIMMDCLSWVMWLPVCHGELIISCRKDNYTQAFEVARLIQYTSRHLRYLSLRNYDGTVQTIKQNSTICLYKFIPHHNKNIFPLVQHANKNLTLREKERNQGVSTFCERECAGVLLAWMDGQLQVLVLKCLWTFWGFFCPLVFQLLL